jgi:simple sugar transport system substrate-binding protein
MVAAMAAKTVDAMINVEPYNAIAEADGIAVSLVDLEAFNDPISRALDQGIPVVALNADAPQARKAYRDHAH